MADVLTSLNRVRYSGLDFNTHADELLARIQVKFATDFNDLAASGLGVMLVDLVSFGLDTLSFYLDRRATDSFLETARTRRSVARLTRQLGYKMRSAIASSVPVTYEILDTFAVPVVIPRGYPLKGPSDLIFEAAQTVTFTPGDRIKEIPCYEGQTYSESFVSDGTANQVFELRRVRTGRYVAGGSVRVVVAGATWTEQPFLTYDQTNHYEVGYNDDPPTVRFGDGVAGNIPTTGAAIVVTYVVTRGRAGQVSYNTITSPVSPLVVNFTTLRTRITNAVGSVGGDDPESIEEARRNAPRLFKTRDVAVTREDYESLGGAYADPLAGRVAIAQAIASRSAVEDLELRNRIATIEGEFEALPALVGAQTTAARAAAQTIRTANAAATASVATAATASAGAATDLTTALSRGRNVKNLAQQIQTDSSDALSHASAINGTLTGIGTGVSDQLTVGTRDTLLSEIGRVVALLTTTGTGAATVVSEQAVQTTSENAAQAKLDTIGQTTSTGALGGVTTALASSAGALGVPSPATGVFAALDAIDAVIVTEAAAENRLDVVRAALAAIYDHVDRLLAADCKSNLVTVPVLARDAGGFYTAPSVSLIQSLQAYLDVRKEVTQTVQVVSGAGFLVRPKLSVRLGVRVNYSLIVAEAAARAALDGVLRNRLFGASLYVSELNDALTSLAAVGFVNVTILGHLVTGPLGTTLSTDKLDASGNLIVATSEVVTKDTADASNIAITTEVFIDP